MRWLVWRAVCCSVLLAFVSSVVQAQRLVTTPPSCFKATPERAKAYAAARKGKGNCAVKCKGCGCKGGPGYRDQDGKCVSYANLNSRCGPPPHLKCIAECYPAIGKCERPTKSVVDRVEAKQKRKRGCGSRGGSGYRGPNGRCVSRKNLRRVCGDPPSLRCRAENVPN